MKRTLALAVCLLVAVSSFAATRRHITEKDLLKFQWIADPRLSPDGTTIAFVRVNVDAKGEKYETSLWSVALAGGEPRRLTNGPRDSQPRWSPDGKTVAFLRSGDKNGKPDEAQVNLLTMSGGEPRAITSMPQSVESIEWSPDGRTIAFTATTRPDDFDDKKKKDDEPKESDVRVINQAVYRANGAGYADPSRNSHIWTIAIPQAASDEPAKPKQVTTGDFDEDAPKFSPDGKTIYFESYRTPEQYYDGRRGDIYSVPAAGGELTKVVSMEGPASRFSVSPDGKWIAFNGFVDKPVKSFTQSELFVASTTPGSQPRNLTASFDGDVLETLSGDQHAPRASGGGAHPVWSADSKSIYVTTAEQGRSNLVRFDVASGTMTPVTTGDHEIVNFDAAKGTSIVIVSTPTHLNDLFAVGANGALRQLTDVNAKLFAELDLTEPEVMWLDGFDGKKIETWVQRPPDFDPSKKYPLILNIHGGPHTAYGYTFFHEMQWMAAKGYVVVYPNPRGSSTYGQEFGNIIQYAYPGDDHKDLMAAVDAVIKKGSIDTAHLGVTGGSGGGVLTNWAIGHTDRFAAAVSQRSIADWSNFWYVADFTLFTPSWFRKAPWEDPQDYVARSPITYVEKIHTPLMLIEGEADYRTPPMAGGEMMFRALKYLHRPVVMVRFPEESHELSRSGKPQHRIERLTHIVNWFDKYLQGKPVDIYDKGLRR